MTIRDIPSAAEDLTIPESLLNSLEIHSDHSGSNYGTVYQYF